MPPGARERFLETARGRVRVLCNAVDPGSPDIPLLLLHGGGTDNAAISWFETFQALGQRGAVYAVDLPGFGYTEVEPVGGPVAQADFVAEVAGLLGLDQVVVLGVSMGGDVALNLALHHPDRVAGLVLIAPGGLAARIGNRWVHRAAWLAAQLSDRVMDPLARLANRHVDAVLRRIVNDISALPVPVRTEFGREARRRGTSMGYRRYNQATLARTAMANNLMPVVGSIRVPTLLFHGVDDRMVSPSNSREAAGRMPNATMVLVGDCGHWAQLEARDRFFDELAAFRSRHGLSAGSVDE